jgi:translation initiation factor 3 subunit A
MSRDQPPAEAPASAAGGRPLLNLGGNKPSWREREAMKASGQAPPPAAAAPATEAPTPEAEAPKRSGYLPPALRRGADGSPAPPASGWREREGSGRSPAPRNESPATGGRYEPPSGRGRFADLGDKGRTQSPASGSGYVPPARRGMDGARGRESEREEPRESLPPAQEATGGKYRPGAFRRTGGQ